MCGSVFGSASFTIGPRRVFWGCQRSVSGLDLLQGRGIDHDLPSFYPGTPVERRNAFVAMGQCQNSARRSRRFLTLSLHRSLAVPVSGCGLGCLIRSNDWGVPHVCSHRLGFFLFDGSKSIPNSSTNRKRSTLTFFFLRVGC